MSVPRIRGSALALLAAVAWLAVLCCESPAAQSARAGLADAPDLPGVEATCSVGAESAAARGRRAEARALGAVDRYPFDPREGLHALSGWTEAADCFRIAGDSARRARVIARMQAWRARVARDYRDHLVRYRLAIVSQHNARALSEIEFLVALLGPSAGPFAARLQTLRNALASHLAEAR